MNTLITTKTVANLKLQTFLFALSLVMHAAALSVAASHPLLSQFFALLETLGWISIIQIWIMVLIKGIQQWCPLLWIKLWTSARAQLGMKNESIVPVEQLKHIYTNVQRLRLALYGLTPEMEHIRRTHFQLLGEAVPALTLPPQHASLYAEFTSLTRVLNHFGFPHLERVQLQQKDVEFVQAWGCDLEARLLQSQKQRQDQQQALDAALLMANHTCRSIDDRYPAALSNPDYHRIKGALLVLTMMADNSALPCHQVHLSVCALQRDIDTILKHLKQSAA